MGGPMVSPPKSAAISPRSLCRVEEDSILHGSHINSNGFDGYADSSPSSLSTSPTNVSYSNGGVSI